MKKTISFMTSSRPGYKFKLLALFMGALGALFFVTDAKAYAQATCDLPVCDIPAQLEALKKLNGDQRFAFYSELDSKYERETSRPKLENLADFGTQAFKLSSQMDVEVWIGNRAAILANRAMIKLATSGTMDGVVYFEKYYNALMGIERQNRQLDIITFWNSLLKDDKITEAKDITELSKFGARARALTLKEPSRENALESASSTMITLTSVRLLTINPVIEGTYKIETQCAQANAVRCEQADTLSIVVGDDWRGITAVFMDSKNDNKIVYEFYGIEFIEGKLIQGMTGPVDYYRAPGSFKLDFDLKTRKIKGQINSTRNTTLLNVTGEMTFNISKLYEMPVKGNLPPIEEIESSYKLKFHRDRANKDFLKTELRLNRYGKKDFKATLREASGKVIYDFPMAYYNVLAGVIVLYASDEDSKGLLKITLAYRTVGSKNIWTGYVHSPQTGEVREIGQDD